MSENEKKFNSLNNEELGATSGGMGAVNLDTGERVYFRNANERQDMLELRNLRRNGGNWVTFNESDRGDDERKRLRVDDMERGIYTRPKRPSRRSNGKAF